VNAALGKLARAARAAGLGGALRFARNGLDAALLRVHAPVLRADAEGTQLRGFLRHRSFLAGVERGDYEPTLRNLILESVGPGTLFVDAGAHVGFYSLLADRAGANVVALEPDPYNLAALRRNLRGTRAEVLGEAVSDSVGSASFHLSSSTTGSSLVDRGDIEMTKSVPVATTTVDGIVSGRAFEVLVLKVDVEGAEPSVLAGARETLRSVPRATVIAEVHPNALAANGATAQDVVGPLRDAGFDVRFVDQEGNVGPVPRSPPKGNVVATRGDLSHPARAEE
jgi:FkbM family methyltransferase